MGAPTALHEDRRQLLADLATLAGYTVEVDAWPSALPDVVRLHPSRPSILFGDAKATEVPTNSDTRQRLLTYMAVAREWLGAGFEVDVVILHGPVVGSGWVRCLTDVAQSVGLAPRKPRCFPVTASDWASSVALALSARPGRPPVFG